MTHVEVVLKGTSTVAPSEMASILTRISKDSPDIFLVKTINIRSIPFANPCYYQAIEAAKSSGNGLPIHIYCYALNDGESIDDVIENGEETLSVSSQTILPARKFDQLWESIICEDVSPNVKDVLLSFMSTAIDFSDRGVSTDIVACNRIILLYGPPGTGKTSLCQGLAQKLTIRFSARYSYGTLMEINTHSIFSKWFAESGKMVKKLFDRINDIASDNSALVFVLIDEVESLATARQSAMNGSDPSDAIRVVNALLTQIDRLRNRKNVVIMATSNMTESIDVAFLSRADIKQYVGPPTRKARYVILQECIEELMQKGLISPEGGIVDYDSMVMLGGSAVGAFKNAEELMKAVDISDGLCGRTLRKLPFLASVYKSMAKPASLSEYLSALQDAAQRETKSKKES